MKKQAFRSVFATLKTRLYFSNLIPFDYSLKSQMEQFVNISNHTSKLTKTNEI